MRKFFFSLFIVIPLLGMAQFDKYFENSTLRIDYYHFGTAETEQYALKELIKEPFWGGTKTKLIDTTNYGQYFVCMTLPDSDVTLYSRGYSTLFGEWQTTEEARNVQKGFEESVIMPFPKETVEVIFYSRAWEGEFVETFRLTVDPADYFIKPAGNSAFTIHEAYIGNADPSKAVDIVILPEGYTETEMEKFVKDCQFFAESVFKYAPYDKHKDKFNIRAVLAPSAHSGASKPGEREYVSTIMSFNYYTFDSERYCMSTDNKTIRDLAGLVPYDQIYILINTEKYGGGGIFNFYCASASGNSFTSDIIIHEFGHGFAGLADEYNDDDTYESMYNLAIEPWEPNISTLVDFDKKWKDLIKKKTPIPTPTTNKYINETGAFEGAGYTTRGMYRPKQDCLMRSFRGHEFCEVCKHNIEKMILFYSE